LREELQLLGCEATEQESGIFRVAGLPFTTWLVETDIMAERDQPVLALVSRVFLNDGGRIIEELKRSGHLALLNYMLQQIQQFRTIGEGFAMQHGFSENLAEVEEELLTKVLAAVPPERLLRGLPPEERLRGLTPEELASALSDEDAARLRELIDQKRRR